MTSLSTPKRSPTIRLKSRKRTVSLPRKLALVGLTAVLGFATVQRLENGPTVATAPDPSNNAQNSADTARATNTFALSPVYFETNNGQWRNDVRYVAHGLRYSLAMTSQGAAFTVNTAGDVKTASLRFLDGNRNAAIEPLEKAIAKTNYLKGSDQSARLTGVDTFGKVAYRNIYPGIDVVFYGHQQELEYDFVVAPHANPKNISFQFDGADRIDIADTGELLIHLADEVITQNAPVAYQNASGTRRYINGAYVERDGAIGFRLAHYDATLPLYIDPLGSHSIRVLADGSSDRE